MQTNYGKNHTTAFNYFKIFMFILLILRIYLNYCILLLRVLQHSVCMQIKCSDIFKKLLDQ